MVIVQNHSESYRLAGDVWVPYFRDKFHDWWLERIFIGDFDGNFICATLIWCPGRAFEGTSEVCNTVSNGLREDARGRVCPDVC